MKVLLVAGAGTSIELGVPGMYGMATEFLSHARQWDVSPTLVEKLMGDPPDVEHLIEELDRICSARATLELIGHSEPFYNQLDKLRAEVEWFVQHAAERIVATEAQLMWGSVLQATGFAEITFVTTNYDRAIELAANAGSVRLDDGFGSFEHRETALWDGYGRSGSLPKLVKLHGSTDWYADAENGNPVKLRHPMPLFARAALHLGDGYKLGSALVLPSREKLLTRAPYPRLSQDFLNGADACDFAIFVGSSLRDNHIRDAAQSTARRVPVYIVNPEGNVCGIDDAHGISQTASTFLISTLPRALSAPDPIRVLTNAKPDKLEGSTLTALRRAMDVRMDVRSRCRALDELDDRGVTLIPKLLEGLLNDTDPTVARYALGLVSLSPFQHQLFAAASNCRHAQQSAFAEDLELLEKLLDVQNSSIKMGA